MILEIGIGLILTLCPSSYRSRVDGDFWLL